MEHSKKYIRGPGHGNHKHGMSTSKIYRLWCSMISRCTNPKVPSYKHYGARGITICKRWRNFENFYADMGERPYDRTLDRIDNNGPYAPENCRWALREEQSHNSRRPTWITFNGETKNLSQWAKTLDIDVSSLLLRLEKWPLEEALTKPRKNYKKGYHR